MDTTSDEMLLEIQPTKQLKKRKIKKKKRKDKMGTPRITKSKGNEWFYKFEPISTTNKTHNFESIKSTFEIKDILNTFMDFLPIYTMSNFICAFSDLLTQSLQIESANNYKINKRLKEDTSDDDQEEVHDPMWFDNLPIAKIIDKICEIHPYEFLSDGNDNDNDESDGGSETNSIEYELQDSMLYCGNFLVSKEESLEITDIDQYVQDEHNTHEFDQDDTDSDSDSDSGSDDTDTKKQGTKNKSANPDSEIEENKFGISYQLTNEGWTRFGRKNENKSLLLNKTCVYNIEQLLQLFIGVRMEDLYGDDGDGKEPSERVMDFLNNGLRQQLDEISLIDVMNYNWRKVLKNVDDNDRENIEVKLMAIYFVYLFFGLILTFDGKKECIVYSSIGKESTSEEENSHDSAEWMEDGKEEYSWIYKQEKYFGAGGDVVNIHYNQTIY